jgi:hypothetical protein
MKLIGMTLSLCNFKNIVSQSVSCAKFFSYFFAKPWPIIIPNSYYFLNEINWNEKLDHFMKCARNLKVFPKNNKRMYSDKNSNYSE